MQPRLFEDCIKKGHQRYANLCGAYARPQIRCKRARQTRINDANQIVHMSGNLATVLCDCSITYHGKTPTHIEGALFVSAKKIL